MGVEASELGFSTVPHGAHNAQRPYHPYSFHGAITSPHFNSHRSKEEHNQSNHHWEIKQGHMQCTYKAKIYSILVIDVNNQTKGCISLMSKRNTRKQRNHEKMKR
jgi:hypothetical protein